MLESAWDSSAEVTALRGRVILLVGHQEFLLDIARITLAYFRGNGHFLKGFAEKTDRPLSIYPDTNLSPVTISRLICLRATDTREHK